MELPAKNLPDVSREPLAHDELLVVVERDQPSVAAYRSHLASVIDVHKCIPVDSAETAVP